MFSTWDSYRNAAAVWPRDAKAGHSDPHARFVVTVDRLFYAASAALVFSIVALLIG